MRQSACLVFYAIMVDNYAAFFNCTPVGRASDSMMAPTYSYSFWLVGAAAYCLLLGPPGSNWCFSFAPELVCYSAPKDLHQNQNHNSLLVKRQTDNTTPGGIGLDRRGFVPNSHKRSKFRHKII